MPIKLWTPGGWPDGSAGAFVLLALLTLVPAGCVLWFMNEALSRESEASRQRVLEAYRGQLRLVRERLDPLWRAHAASLDAGGVDPRRHFDTLVGSGVVDGAVVLTPGGAVAYPDAGAREQLARIDEQPADASAKPWALAPLRVSLGLLDVERPIAQPGVIRQTAVPQLWALTSGDGRTVALYSTERLESMMHDFLHEITSPGILFMAIPPDGLADAEAIAAGPWLPGWQVSFFVMDDAVPGDQRAAVYLAVGLAALVVMTLAGVAAGQAFRRHLRIARLKTDLVAAASHELRTPLASMRVLVDGLLADPEIDAAKTREYLGLMAVENARLSRLIENFLTFSRLDRGRYRFTLAPADPSAIVGSAVDAIRDRLPPTSTLDVEVEPSLPPVLVDLEAVGTALVNLLDNALKYTPGDQQIGVRASRDGTRFVQFVVSDNGIGIAAHEQRRIFRRFYRVDQRLSRETSGVGLGLSIVALIARGHGGTATVRSEPGAGSTFTLRLPCADEAAA